MTFIFHYCTVYLYTLTHICMDFLPCNVDQGILDSLQWPIRDKEHHNDHKYEHLHVFAGPWHILPFDPQFHTHLSKRRFETRVVFKYFYLSRDNLYTFLMWLFSDLSFLNLSLVLQKEMIPFGWIQEIAKYVRVGWGRF